MRFRINRHPANWLANILKIITSKFCHAEDFGFCIKVSVAQSLIFFVGAFCPLILDPRLLHHARFPARHYPHYAFWVAPVLSLLIFVTTYCLLASLDRKQRIWWATAPSWILSLPMFWILRQELPHLALLNNLVLGSILTVIAIWVRYHPIETSFLTNSNLLEAAKLERTKEEISFWRTGLLAVLAGYLTLLVSWFNSIVKMNESITPDPGEQFLLNYYGNVFISIMSLWFLFGVVGEIANKTSEALKIMERIPKPKA
jgi:hypothetical protein